MRKEKSPEKKKTRFSNSFFYPYFILSRCSSAGVRSKLDCSRNYKFVLVESKILTTPPLQDQTESKRLLIGIHITHTHNSILIMLNIKVSAVFLIVAATTPAVNAWYCLCGSYCPNATLPYQHPVTCPVGYYCPIGGYLKQTFPVACPAGYQCPRAGLCTFLPTPCGTFTTKGSSAPQLCPAGTYSPGNSSKCTECTSVIYCPNPGTCKPQCPQPQCNPLKQPPGYICPNDPFAGCNPICINPAICGTTAPNQQGTSATGGIHRPTSSTTPVPFKCGYYSPPGLPQTPSYQQPCRSGYYCPSGSSPYDPITPIKCPGGYYCGQKTCNPIPCECGYKCPEGSSAPIASHPPYYIPGKLATSQTLCPIGHKCDKPALCNATKCHNGTFVTCAGKISCDPCAHGRYCPTVTTSVLCPAGWYCAGGVYTPTKCPANYYCHIGSSAPIPCPSGTTTPAGSKNKSQCK